MLNGFSMSNLGYRFSFVQFLYRKINPQFYLPPLVGNASTDFELSPAGQLITLGNAGSRALKKYSDSIGLGETKFSRVFRLIFHKNR